MDEFISIPVSLLEKDGLSKTSMIVYGFIVHEMDADGVCSLSNKEIADKLRVTRETASRSVRTLEKEGLIKRELTKNEKTPFERDIRVIERQPA